MNKRINQLLEQARTDCSQLGNKPATTVGYDELERFVELVLTDERAGREWCGNAENPVKCIGHNDQCRGFTCKHFAEFLYEKNRTLSIEINRLKTSKDLCGND